MHHLIATILGGVLVAFPCAAAETNSIAGETNSKVNAQTTLNPTNLKRLAIQSLEVGDTEGATRHATEWLNTTTNRRAYYYGTVVHDANQIMGVAALKEGRTADAKAYLLKAGASSGSPQLNSFGPRMFLAQQLLEKNEKEVVVEYLDLVAKFWASSSDEYLRQAEARSPGASATIKELNREHQETNRVLETGYFGRQQAKA